MKLVECWSVDETVPGLIVEPCIRMCTEDHVASAIDNATFGVSGAVVVGII